MKKSKIKKLVKKLVKNELKQLFKTNYAGAISLEEFSRQPTENHSEPAVQDSVVS